MRLRKIAVVVAGVGILASIGPLSFAKPSSGGHGNPPGNNGTVKVDGVPFDQLPNNEPHVGCTFQIDFYGYDQGNLYATVIFTGQAPTGGGTLATDTIFIGGDPAGGGTDLDASRTYNLSAALRGIRAHPQQGYHVMLTVHADRSIGADVKHKVFWVERCDATPAPAPPPTPSGSPGASPPPGGPPSPKPPTAGPAEPVNGAASFTG